MNVGINCFILFFILFCSFYISFTKQSLHSTLNIIKCEKQILPSVGFEPTTSCIRGKRLTARPRGTNEHHEGDHARERTTPRLISKYLESIFLQKIDLHWLIESIPDCFWRLFPMPDGIWLVPLWTSSTALKGLAISVQKQSSL